MKIEKLIPKYFIAEESSNVTILDGNISWCRYLFGDRTAPLQNGWFCTATSLRFASIWLQPLGLDISAKKRQSQLIVAQPLMISQYLSSDRVWRISISQNCLVEKYRQSLLSYVFICRLLPSFKITRSQLPSGLVAQLVEQRWSVPKAQWCQNFHSFTVWAYFLSRTIAQKEYHLGYLSSTSTYHI